MTGGGNQTLLSCISMQVGVCAGAYTGYNYRCFSPWSRNLEKSRSRELEVARYQSVQYGIICSCATPRGSNAGTPDCGASALTITPQIRPYQLIVFYHCPQINSLFPSQKYIVLVFFCYFLVWHFGIFLNHDIEIRQLNLSLLAAVEKTTDFLNAV